MQNRVFFPQVAVDTWGIDGKVDVTATDLMVLAQGRTYKIVEAIHVRAEVTGANDHAGLVGKVKARAELEGLGAEILEGSMILGENAYDVVPGWIGTPAGSYAEHLGSPAHAAALAKQPAAPAASSDEEVLRVLSLDGP